MLYTPSIAGWGLGLVILLYFIFWKRQRIFIFTIIYGVVCLYMVYRVMQKTDPFVLASEFTVGTDEHFTLSDWTLRYLNGIRAVIGEDFSLIAGPPAVAIFAAACLSWRFREVRYGIVCVWALAVAFLSVALYGSSFSFPNRDIERALIIIPPLMVGAVLLIDRYLFDLPGRPSGPLRGWSDSSWVCPWATWSSWAYSRPSWCAASSDPRCSTTRTRSTR